jgi:hypothetical protein
MNLGQVIDIQLINIGGQPLKLRNVLVTVTLFTTGNLRYVFQAGRTNEIGFLRISYAEIEKQRVKNSTIFLMDYNTRLEACDAKVRIMIPTELELRTSLQRASRNCEQPPDWASIWPSNELIETSLREVELIGPITSVSIGCTPSRKL